MGFSRVRGQTRPDVYRFVENERERQIHDLGYDALHDDAHALPDFATIIHHYASAGQNADVPISQRREIFIKIAATAVAALESIERRPGGR